MTAGLTPGRLPLSAFAHPDPTAVAVIDLDESLAPRLATGGRPRGGERDGLVLVRLHQEPLAVVHVELDFDGISSAELLAAIWDQAHEAIDRHVRRRGCLPRVADPDAFATALSHRSRPCPQEMPRSFGRRAAVIVCTAGRGPQLERCLRSLLAQVGDFEVLVVDNRPADGGTRRIVTELAVRDGRLRYVAEPRAGLSVARNRGVAATDAEIVAFTDDDVVVEETWLSWLLDAFAEPDVSVACGLVLPLELQTEAQKRFECYDGFSKGLERRTFGPKTGQARGRLLFPYLNGVVGTGNSMAFRRDALIAAGGFDPALGAGSPVGAGEETCAFCAALLGGGRIVYEPRAVCWHEHRRDGGALVRQVSGYGTSVGAILTRALLTDPRFYLALAQAPAVLLAHADSSNAAGSQAGGPVAKRPAELDRVRRLGMLRGGVRYLQGRRRARRLGLSDAIAGS